jgi:dephospho-CoA kinase
MQQMKSIAFSGKPRAGKDVAAGRLCELGYIRVQIAEPLYRICEHLQRIFGLEVRKNRTLLQNLGQKMKILRHEDVWMDIACSEIKAAEARGLPVVISDCRFQNEYNKLKTLGFLIVRIERNFEGTSDDNNNHYCESQLDNADFDIILENNDTIDNFIQKIDDMLLQM